MNSVCLSGRMVKDPEISYTQNQRAVINFTLAIDRQYKGADGKHVTDFIRCTAWSGSASFLQKYAVKGARIGVTGSIQTRRVEGENGEAPRYYTAVNCDSVEILEFPKRKRGSGKRCRRRDTEESEIYDEEPGSGYVVYAPPGFDENLEDGGELPF